MTNTATNGRRHIRRIAGLAAGLALAAPALAAAQEDLPPPPSWHFSGYAAGVGAGTFAPKLGGRVDGQPVKARTTDGEAWFFANFNLRLDDHWLVGIEGELSITGGLDAPEIFPPTFLGDIFGGSAALGLRLQHAVNDRFAPYVRASWARIEIRDMDLNGYRLAGGFELRILRGLMARFEVMHDDFSRRTVAPGRTISPSITSVRGGLLYRF
ncbi:MAG: hypothetical protein KatS3mg119_1562 [Rhodothalassiaceae bacterium]|nr:MAG: hypothetical protein KatS3mg119_1562 [Rhodothalassiaceae bacterium]